jgi:hypothetical protein
MFQVSKQGFWGKLARGFGGKLSLFMAKIQYTKNMDVDIKFCQSAFKHNISEADI